MDEIGKILSNKLFREIQQFHDRFRNFEEFITNDFNCHLEGNKWTEMGYYKTQCLIDQATKSVLIQRHSFYQPPLHLVQMQLILSLLIQFLAMLARGVICNELIAGN